MGEAPPGGGVSAVDRYEWERLVRRCVLTSPTKLVALTVATYANRDGSGIYPGVTRLTAVTALSERSVRGALKTLREVGLLLRTRDGSRNGRRAYADEYALTIPVDLLDRVELLDPDESAAPPAADRVGSPAPDAVSPACDSGSPAGGAVITGTSCTPPTHYQANHQPITNRELDYVGKSPLRANGEKNVIALNGRTA